MKIYRTFTTKEKSWIAKFEKVMSQAPDSLLLFVGEGVTVYTTGENNERHMDDTGSVDSKATHINIRTKMQYDGGAY